MSDTSHHASIMFGDGKAASCIEYGDGSTGPFLELEVTNVEGDFTRMHLERDEVRRFAVWLSDRAEGEERWERR